MDQTGMDYDGPLTLAANKYSSEEKIWIRQPTSVEKHKTCRSGKTFGRRLVGRRSGWRKDAATCVTKEITYGEDA